MSAGRTVRVYLADGSAGGLRHAEIVNWTGQALACPRSRIAELARWPEARRPGVYFLFGRPADGHHGSLYIGEAEVVAERLRRHQRAQAGWTEVVLCTSKDDGLTKSHVKYLEARLIALALSSGRYRLLNAVTPRAPALSRPDRVAMDEFVDGVCTLLAVLTQGGLCPLLPCATGTGQRAAPSVDLVRGARARRPVGAIA